MNINNKNEAVYSIVYLLFSRNKFSYGSDLLKLYHLTSTISITNQKEKEINLLTNMLNSNLDFIKWKDSIQDNKSMDENNEYARQIAEKCTFQFQLLIDNLDLADIQVKQMIEIYIYYNRLNELGEILLNYSNNHPDYLNAHKFLFEFELKFKRKISLNLFQKIARLSPCDSFILKYCKYFRDLIMSIDCLFDMLDYYQWKYSVDCWSCLNKLLLESDRSDPIKECIIENWKLRESYWIPYHFSAFTEIYKDINKYRFSIGIMLLGPSNEWLKKIAKLYKFDLVNFESELEIFNWLIS